MSVAPAPDDDTPTVTGSWNVVVQVLEQAGVQDAFGLPADDLDLLGALDTTGIRLVLCRDQRNALFMATGYALQSGRTGIAFTGKGPAVTNALTGLLEAKSSAAPLVLLSAGTSANRRGAGAFQELDQLAVVAPLVKWAARIDDPARLVPMLRRALLIAREGVPGPVYLELPDHLLTAEIPYAGVEADEYEALRPRTVQLAEDSTAVRTLKSAERPVLLVGGGMRHHNADRTLERLADHMGAAVFCTASGRGAFDESHPRFCGLAGLYLPEAAGELWLDTDCVVTLGSRLEETATFGWPCRIGTEVPVVQVNVEAAEFHTDFAGPKVLADAAALIAGQLARESVCAPSPDWRRRTAAIHESLHTAHRAHLAELAEKPELHIAEVLAALSDVLPDDLVLVQENGLQDMWSYSYPVHHAAPAGGSVVPSEQTSLGFGAAAAAGVKAAAPDRPVVALVGDGAFGLFESDLVTVAEQQLAVLYVVLDNGGYGWLQSQLDQREKPLPRYRFTDPAGPRPGGREVPGVQRQLLADKATLRADVAQAWKYCESRRPVVLHVPVAMTDSLFGAVAGGGDFPLLPAPDHIQDTQEHAADAQDTRGANGTNNSTEGSP
ncbi:thiamine pyrophosphate-binding protein [Streptomyces brevispora]|uniref:Thiamine pyrophosphate-binding protein n=1 Tax=Streptomyces brevispora TaxID=887462 RepID=A0ABZ1FZ42_9ACTN|nr:thiamine pyrophosphate-binding protein [Streptomyces brevispora]WSC12298.1 thiamine pyrophosphate-binding protein [Streptomyces brevispora]